MMYKNKKTGNRYMHLAYGTDCTNSRDGTSVIVYCNADNEHAIFVRDAKEFEDKFEVIMNESSPQPK